MANMRPFTTILEAASRQGVLKQRQVIGQLSRNGPASIRGTAQKAEQKATSSARRLNVGRQQATQPIRCQVQRRFNSSWSPPNGIGIATQPKRADTRPLLGALFGASAIAYVGSALISHGEVKEAETTSGDNVKIIDTEDTDRKIRLAELPNHNRDADSKWVVRGSSVYDITDFIQSHPGGEIIMRACGGSIDPYWKIFSIHNKKEVEDILNEYFIGHIDEQDLNESGQINWSVLGEKAKEHDVDDPFKYEPERDENLIYQTQKPCNAETPSSLLTDFLTPLRLFFVRNHLWVPQTHESPQSVTIELSDGEETTYSLNDLKEKFKAHTITATLQCAGNRRGHMSKAAAGKTSGLQWDVGAIGTAEFTGVRLRDILRDSGYCLESDCLSPRQCEDEDADKHVIFTSPSDTYATSIPLQTALNPQADVLIAWNMNGEPINRDHGGPLRAVVPGTTAARSVKWLGRISVGPEESQSQWSKRDYKCFGPNVKQADVKGEDWDEAQSIQESPVQSAITNIRRAKGEQPTSVQGFAFSGGGRSIVRVDVSADGGTTWKQAEIQKDRAKGSKRWAWTLWNADWSQEELKASNDTEFVVKAIDEAYNSQPSSFDSTWNFRGLCANAWHRMRLPAESADA